MQSERFKMMRLELGPYGTNSYIIVCRRTNASVVVDAPDNAQRILDALEGTSARYILITHGHFDHLGALAELRSKLHVPVAAHVGDAGDLPVQVDRLLQDGDRIEVGALQFKVFHAPGHTAGSLCFLLDDILIAGDTLFPGGPGRTGSPEDFRLIMESLGTKIFCLSDGVQVYPGHGEATSLARERPLFEAFVARGHRSGLCGDVLWESS